MGADRGSVSHGGDRCWLARSCMQEVQMRCGSVSSMGLYCRQVKHCHVTRVRVCRVLKSAIFSVVSDG